MGLIDKIFGSGVGSVVSTIGGTIDEIVVTPQDKFDWVEKQAEQEWRFKTIEEENFQKEQDRILHYYEIEQKDRGSARELGKIEVQSSDVFVRRFKYIFAGLITLLILAFLGTMLFHEVPTRSKDIVVFILGCLTGILTNIVGYFYGSSQGSSIKTQMIKKELDDESLGNS